MPTFGLHNIIIGQGTPFPKSFVRLSLYQPVEPVAGAAGAAEGLTPNKVPAVGVEVVELRKR